MPFFNPSSSVAAGSPGPLENLDASTNPNYPEGTAGDRYRITVAGKVGGASGSTVEAGDVVECIADNAGGTQASVGTSWIILQANIAGMTAAGLAIIQAADASEQTALLAAVVGDSGSGGSKGLVPAPSAGDAEAGKFLKADGTWAAPSGSSSISMPLAARVETAANGGNDETGAAGDPSKPFETMLAAYNAGARMLHLGAGTHAGITKTGDITLSFVGHGVSATTITAISSTNGGAVYVQDLGLETATIGSISTVLNDPATPGDSGGPIGDITLINLRVSGSVNGNGQNGADGGAGGSFTGGNGTDASTFIGYRVKIGGSLNLVGGTGGNAGEDGEAGAQNGGSGGYAGSISGHDVIVEGNINANGGGFGTGVNGGTDGAPGSANTIDVVNLTVGGTVNLGVSGETAAVGTLNCHNAKISTISMDGSVSNPGVIQGAFIFADNLNGAPDTTYLSFARLAGNFYGNA